MNLWLLLNIVEYFQIDLEHMKSLRDDDLKTLGMNLVGERLRYRRLLDGNWSMDLGS